MKKFFQICLIFSVVLFSAQSCFAIEKILVLPDNIQFESTNYYVYPDSSVMFASDTINNLKKTQKVQTVSMKEIRDTLRASSRTKILADKAIKEFKYNYNIDFIDLKDLSMKFDTNKVLLISSTTDTQNYFLRRSIWTLANIPGVSVIDPQYRLNTFAALIDVDKEEVLWERKFAHNIRADEYRLLPQGFAPAGEQLEKIKFYSTYLISPEIALAVETKLAPPVVAIPNQQPLQPEFVPQEVPQNIEPINYKPVSKPVLNSAPDFLRNNSMINDL